MSPIRKSPHLLSRVWLAGVVAGFMMIRGSTPVDAQEIQPQSLVNRVPASVTIPVSTAAPVVDEAQWPGLQLPIQPVPTLTLPTDRGAAFEREHGADWAALIT